MRSKVWIIDDDKIFRYTSEKYLLELNPNLQIASFNSAEKALEALREEDPGLWPEVVFIDLNLPVFDGWDFLETVKKQFGEPIKQIRFFVVSSSVDQRDKERAEEYDFVCGYKVKPLSVKEFSDTIID